jgi:hypothetical protein
MIEFLQDLSISCRSPRRRRFPLASSLSPLYMYLYHLLFNTIQYSYQSSLLPWYHEFRFYTSSRFRSSAPHHRRCFMAGVPSRLSTPSPMQTSLTLGLSKTPTPRTPLLPISCASPRSRDGSSGRAGGARAPPTASYPMEPY